MIEKPIGEWFPNAGDLEWEREEARTTFLAIGIPIQEPILVPIWLRVVMKVATGATTDYVIRVKNGTYPNWRLYWPKF